MSQSANSASDAKSAQSDLFWLACLYVNDELSAADCEAFEDRLCDDQAAREAVAAATELSDATHAAFAIQSAAPTIDERPVVATSYGRVVQGLLALAAALLLAFFLNRDDQVAEQSAPSGAVQPAPAVDPQLAVLWAQQVVETPVARTDAGGEWAEDVVLGEDLALTEPLAESTDWMWFALSASEATSDAGGELDDMDDAPDAPEGPAGETL